MRYLKTQIMLPEKAINKIKKASNISEEIENIVMKYYDKQIPPKDVKGRYLSVSISYDLAKKIHKDKRKKVKDYIQSVIAHWAEEN